METAPVFEVPDEALPAAEHEKAEDSGILDKDSRAQIEQLLISCLQAMGNHMANVVPDAGDDEADEAGRECEGACNGDVAINGDNDAAEKGISGMIASELGESLEVRSGKKEQARIVSCRYRHNHTLDGINDIGSGQKSAAVRTTIRNMIMDVLTVQRVMQQLTMAYGKFTRIMSGSGQQLSRDHFVTYDDVYNIWYSFMNKAMRKDPDPVLSCIKWTEKFEESNAFT